MLKSINHWLEKFNTRPLFNINLVVLVGILGFGLGRLTKLEENKVPVEILSPAPTITSEEGGETGKTGPATSGSNAKQVVVSKSGTKYHWPWCGSARNIKEENKIWFNSPEEARRAGYKPAANCPGLE